VNALLRREAVHTDLVPRFRRLRETEDEHTGEAVQLLNDLVRAEVVSHATKCGIERVFTHGTLGAARRWEDISFAAEHIGQISEIASNLLGKRDGMRSARFHFTGRDLPDPIDEVDLMPFGVPEFAGAYEHMRRYLQS